MERFVTQQSVTANDRRAQILAAATNFFCMHGYSGTRMSDIAEAISVTKPIVYRYFKSKEDLFEAWVDLVLVAQANSIIDRIDNSSLSVKDEARRILLNSIEGLKIKQVLAPWRIALIEADNFPQISQLVCDKFKTPIFRSICQMFERGIKNGELKNHDPDELTVLFCSPIAAVASIRAAFGEKHHFEVDIATLFDAHHKSFFDFWGK